MAVASVVRLLQVRRSASRDLTNDDECWRVTMISMEGGGQRSAKEWNWSKGVLTRRSRGLDKRKTVPVSVGRC